MLCQHCQWNIRLSGRWWSIGHINLCIQGPPTTTNIFEGSSQLQLWKLTKRTLVFNENNFEDIAIFFRKFPLSKLVHWGMRRIPRSTISLSTSQSHIRSSCLQPWSPLHECNCGSCDVSYVLCSDCFIIKTNCQWFV